MLYPPLHLALWFKSKCDSLRWTQCSIYFPLLTHFPDFRQSLDDIFPEKIGKKETREPSSDFIPRQSSRLIFLLHQKLRLQVDWHTMLCLRVFLSSVDVSLDPFPDRWLVINERRIVAGSVVAASSFSKQNKQKTGRSGYIYSICLGKSSVLLLYFSS